MCSWVWIFVWVFSCWVTSSWTLMYGVSSLSKCLNVCLRQKQGEKERNIQSNRVLVSCFAPCVGIPLSLFVYLVEWWIVLCFVKCLHASSFVLKPKLLSTSSVSPLHYWADYSQTARNPELLEVSREKRTAWCWCLSAFVLYVFAVM